MSKPRREHFCARGCGMYLEPHWHFCPACGQGFGKSDFETVLQSARARDGKVRSAARPDERRDGR